MGFKVGLRRFSILIWKNALLKKRHYLQTLFEVIIPAALFTALVAIHVKGGPNVSPNQKDAVYNRTIPYPLQYCQTLVEHTYNGSLTNRTLSYTDCPTTSIEGECSESLLVKDIMTRVQDSVDGFLTPFCIGLAEDLYNITSQFTNITLIHNDTDAEPGSLRK